MREMLLGKLRAEKKWVELGLLESQEVHERPPLLRNLCECAAKAHDEDGALYLFDLLMIAVDDVQANALRAEGPPRENLSVRTRHYDEAAKTERSRCALTLWRSAPEFRESHCHNRDYFESGVTKEPTLLKYKQRLMQEVIARWHSTSSEDEAEAIDTVILEMMARQDAGGEDLLVAAFRNMPCSTSHRDRTLRAILKIISKTSSARKGKDPVGVLWIGMVRSFSRKELVQIGSILCHVPLSGLETNSPSDLQTSPLIQAISRDAEAYRAMHDAMHSLKDALAPGPADIKAFIPTYPCLRTVELSIAVAQNHCMPEQEECVFHDMLAALRTQICTWIDNRTRRGLETPTIKLRVFWPVSHAKPKFDCTVDLRLNNLS